MTQAAELGSLPPIGRHGDYKLYRWSADNSVEIEEDRIPGAESFGELAASDDPVGRAPESLVPLSDPPSYGFASRPLLGWSNGGPRRVAGRTAAAERRAGFA